MASGVDQDEEGKPEGMAEKMGITDAYNFE